MEQPRIGVFGGTFDPIHNGHLAAVDDAASALGLQSVLFVPNSRPPHKQGQTLTAPEHRIAMIERAIAGNPRFLLSTIELERPGLSYTLDTLRALRSALEADVDLYFLVGWDALPQLRSWHEPETLLAEFQIVVMDRATGGSVDWSEVERDFPDIRRLICAVHVAQLEISSEEIRRRVKLERPIRYLVPPGVESYIRGHSLYR